MGTGDEPGSPVGLVQALIVPQWSSRDFGQEPRLRQMTSELLASGRGLSATVGGHRPSEPPPEA